jgi:hypothetical protein
LGWKLGLGLVLQGGLGGAGSSVAVLRRGGRTYPGRAARGEPWGRRVRPG